MYDFLMKSLELFNLLKEKPRYGLNIHHMLNGLGIY